MNWHQALDVQMDTHRWCMDNHGEDFLYSYFHEILPKRLPEDKHDLPNWFAEYSLIRHIQQTLWRADTMYITSDMMHVVMQAAHDLPPEYEFSPEMLLCPMGFVLFEEGIHGQDKNGKDIVMNAIAWERSPTSDGHEAVIVWYFTDPYDEHDYFNEHFREFMAKRGASLPPLILTHFYPMSVGQKLPTPIGQGSEIVCEILKIFVALQILSHQTIASQARMRPDRSARKRFAKQFPDQPERLITLITLRRKKPARKDGEEPVKVEWSRRWLVRGFWRKQWYPKSQTHGWKYIHEYIKGPEDKPLVITERRVFDFRR